METVLLIILGLAALALAVALWIGAVRRFFALAGPRPQPFEVTAGDGWVLWAWHRPAKVRRYAEPVLLCHGLANNHRFMEFQEPRNLAAVLCDAGFDCFTVELRGAGRAAGGHRSDASFDDHARFDVPALVKFALEKTGAKQAFWVGHSLGGLAGLAAAEEGLQRQLKGVVTIGSPVFFHLRGHVRWLLEFGVRAARLGRFRLDWLAAAFAPLAGWAVVPGGNGLANQRNLPGPVQRRLLAVVIAPVWRGVLVQLLDWAKHDAFRSTDQQLDYRTRVAALQVPLLVVGGAADHIAPPQTSEEFFALAGSPDKQLLLLGKAHGQQLDYGHGDLLTGTRVDVELYPRLLEWLRSRATPVSG